MSDKGLISKICILIKTHTTQYENKKKQIIQVKVDKEHTSFSKEDT